MLNSWVIQKKGNKFNNSRFGMSWSEQKLGHLLTADYDGKICVWDVESNSSEAKNSF